MSPVITDVAQGQGVHDLEASIAMCARGECVAACRGPSPWQVIQRMASELGRARSFPRSFQQAGEVRRKCGDLAVGPTHIRGVAGVTAGANLGFTRRGWRESVEG